LADPLARRREIRYHFASFRFLEILGQPVRRLRDESRINMAEPWGVIFDMDGVLVDSFQAHFESWQSLANEVGVVYSAEAFHRTFGRTGREIIHEEWGRTDWPLDHVDRLVHRKEVLYRELVEREFPAMDGAAELIENLAAAGCRIAIGSSGPRENVELAIDRLAVGTHLAAWVTGHDVTRGKPDPEVFLKAAERMTLSPDRCIVIEDSPPGIEAARRAEMACVGVISTGHTPADAAGATLAVRSLRELNPENLSSLLTARR
jgi:beta-phosphoglucomutase